MKEDNFIYRFGNESANEYIDRLCKNKDDYEMTWQQIADIVEQQVGIVHSESWYRKKKNLVLNKMSTRDRLIEIEQEKIKVRDERNQINAIIRDTAREEYFKELAEEIAENLSPIELPKIIVPKCDNKIGILCISDWHYGLDVDIYHNKYDTDIAKWRVVELLSKTISIIEKEGIDEIYVVNLGDMISGRIHLPLRINSKVDTVTQTLEVADILGQFLNDLSHHAKLHYASVCDNHSRVEPNKKQSVTTESFHRFIDALLMKELRDNKNIDFIENTYGDDIASFEVLGHKVVAVHGDKDSQSKVIGSLNSYLQEHIDMILSAHMHHFSANEGNETQLYCNGSMIGTDDFAHGLRVHSKPSQLFIVATPSSVDDVLYKIKL